MSERNGDLIMDSSPRPHARGNAALVNEPIGVRHATCPMCHTVALVSQQSVDDGADWRCVTCGQHWDAARLAAVAAYAVWRVDHDR